MTADQIVDERPARDDPTEDHTEPGARQERIATILFFLIVAIAVPALFYLGRDQWFFLDEWDFLAVRELTWGDLMRPHNEHWSTVPIILYRVTWPFVGLHHYWPYQAFTIGTHVLIAVLLRAVMRRNGVNPWLALAGPVVFLFLGPGRENIVWAFQIGFTGAAACSLGHLLLVDHDGDDRRRDLAGIGLGILALTFSGVGVTMAVAPVVAVLLRRGWRAAAVQAAPLLAVYGTWRLAYGTGGSPTQVGRDALRLVYDIVSEALRAIVAFNPLTIVLLIGVALGAVLVVRAEGARGAIRRHASAIGLLVAAGASAGATALIRSGMGVEAASRYGYLVALALLPAIMVCLDAVVRRWRVLLVPVVLVLLAAVPGNISRFDPEGIDRLLLGSEANFLAIARAPIPDGMPDDVEVNGTALPGVSAGWVRQAVEEGRVPPITTKARLLQPTARLTLTFIERHEVAGRDCRAVPFGQIEVADGELLRLATSRATIFEVVDGTLGPASFTIVAQSFMEAYEPHDGHPEIRLEAVEDVTIAVAEQPMAHRPQVCRTP